MSNQELILDAIKTKGPVIPNQIAKIIETDILFASAHLSELVSSNKLRISHTKIGGTPVYFLPGQESRLQDLYKYLNNKDQKAYNLLKEKKILQDEKLDPIIRVALRSIKDFAVPVHISINDKKILFWKWYMLSNDEAGALIKLQFQPKTIEKPEEHVQENKHSPEQTQKPKSEIKHKESQPEQQKPGINKQETKPEVKIQEPKIKEQKPVEKQIKLKTEGKKDFKPKQDLFLSRLQQYFDIKKIKVIEYNILRKNSEIDAIVKFSSVVGELDYYCKAKNKKSINDTDLSNAFVQGQLKKLPVLFLMNGNLTKKAEELLNTEFKKGIVVKKI